MAHGSPVVAEEMQCCESWERSCAPWLTSDELIAVAGTVLSGIDSSQESSHGVAAQVPRDSSQYSSRPQHVQMQRDSYQN